MRKLEEVIEIRNISMPQIKEEMLALLLDKKTRYADEIAAELKLDIKDVIEAFRQLQEEGTLFVDEIKLKKKGENENGHCRHHLK